jgi:4-amino-4-deoxychorismate lyase
MIQSPLSIVNSRIQSNLSVLDRGLAYGDGVFETMHVNRGDITLWQYHYERMAKGLARLHIALPLEKLCEHLQATMTAIGDVVGDGAGTLKLMVTRGEGQRGYAPSGHEEPSLVSVFTPLSDIFAQANKRYQENGVEVHCCTEYLPINESLAGIKTLNQLPYVLASYERQGLSAQEGLLFTQDGLLIEATARNIFLVKNNEVFTPRLNQCGVEGIMRRVVMEIITQETTLTIKEIALNKKSLVMADEVFLSNSLSQLWPVTRCENQLWPCGEITQKIQQSVRGFLSHASTLSFSYFLSMTQQP